MPGFQIWRPGFIFSFLAVQGFFTNCTMDMVIYDYQTDWIGETDAAEDFADNPTVDP